MKKICIYLLLLVSKSLFGQVNLVPNPSFEDTVSCPNYANQIDKALYWHASRNTPDYFNGCDWITGNQSVPNNFRGYQYAHSGNAYVGVAAYSLNTFDFSENFTCKLLDTLSIGTKFLVSFYISCSDIDYRLTCNKLGTLFSTENYNSNNPSPMKNFCQFYSDSIVTDTLNWILLHGSFIADSNYTYLTFGRFFSDSLTNTIYLPPAWAEAYYYIDDISVIADTTTTVKELNATSKLLIYPNPLQDKVKIKSIDNVVRNAQLFNIEGRLIKEFNVVDKTENELNLMEFASGLYILKIDYKKGNSSYHRLIKQ
jgi:hypothetical protein